MVHRSTEEVVRRVLPLIERFALLSVDKALLLQYLSARAGIEWGTLILIEEVSEEAAGLHEPRLVLVVRDRLSGEIQRVTRPDCLPLNLDIPVLEEYKRLAINNTLAGMNRLLFDHLFWESHCQHCEFQGEEYEQFHRECRYAGKPVNFSRRQSEARARYRTLWAGLT